VPYGLLIGTKSGDLELP